MFFSYPDQFDNIFRRYSRYLTANASTYLHEFRYIHNRATRSFEKILFRLYYVDSQNLYWWKHIFTDVNTIGFVFMENNVTPNIFK